MIAIRNTEEFWSAYHADQAKVIKQYIEENYKGKLFIEYVPLHYVKVPSIKNRYLKGADVTLVKIDVSGMELTNRDNGSFDLLMKCIIKFHSALLLISGYKFPELVVTFDVVDTAIYVEIV
jgi:hypothetical protein